MFRLQESQSHIGQCRGVSTSLSENLLRRIQWPRAEEFSKFITKDNHVVIMEQACLTDGFLLLRNFSVTISVSPHVCFILV